MGEGLGAFVIWAILGVVFIVMGMIMLGVLVLNKWNRIQL